MVTLSDFDLEPILDPFSPTQHEPVSRVAASPNWRDDASTIRDRRYLCPEHGVTDCSPLLNGCSLVNNYFAALDRLCLVLERHEAALTAIRELPNDHDLLMNAGVRALWTLAGKGLGLDVPCARCGMNLEAHDRGKAVGRAAPAERRYGCVEFVARAVLAGGGDEGTKPVLNLDPPRYTLADDLPGSY